MSSKKQCIAVFAILGVLVGGPAWSQTLVGWWEAEGNALDSAGTNHGTMENGATFGDGVWGQGFELDGSDDYVAIPDSADFFLDGELTVAFWMRYESCTHHQGWCALVTKSPSGWVMDFHFGVGINRNTGQMSMYIGDGASICYDYAGPDLRDGLWHHVAATYDQAFMAYFVDGYQVSGAPCTLALTPNTEDLEIGAESGEPGLAAFEGGIDDVMLFDYDLWEEEVLVLTILFDDGFESGDTQAWSSALP